jgi:hypothetical protein
MRRFYNNGTSYLETITKGATNLTPGGAVANIAKKVIKNKEDKKSRNPYPKTPKMMGEDKDVKKEKPIDEVPLKNFREKMDKMLKNKKNKKFEKPVGKIKPEVRPARKMED